MKKLDTLLIGLIVSTIIIITVSFVSATVDNINKTSDGNTNDKSNLGGEESQEQLESFTGLLIGLDASKGLTDVLMVGVMDIESGDIKVVSVPRDLEIDFGLEEFQQIKENNPDNNVQYCKLNEVYSYTGHNERALKDLKEIIGIITGLEIDYMARIDVNGFSDLVDVIGGVEFYVPEDMYYRDPFQDLYIDLEEGLQMLDGDKAEQLVRYRKYQMGDLQRIKVQQEFMVTLFDKVMNVNDFDQVKQLATTGYGIFEADFGLVLALQYAEYFFELDINKVLSTTNMVTIPSYGEKIDEAWYQRWDVEEAHQVVSDLLEGPPDTVGEVLEQQEKERAEQQEGQQTISEFETE
ncbi:MAG: hypothetical protein CVU84_07215 [Firmicutes bacterium HGW-Firmicutes-1]|jgi:LCP family protein required for cell wall assembly|nr:MAG: hypothetical protein CVU84_07215 [Firmicutes bacterium HGW-Firmicutes-1]